MIVNERIIVIHSTNSARWNRKKALFSFPYSVGMTHNVNVTMDLSLLCFSRRSFKLLYLIWRLAFDFNFWCSPVTLNEQCSKAMINTIYGTSLSSHWSWQWVALSFKLLLLLFSISTKMNLLYGFSLFSRKNQIFKSIKNYFCYSFIIFYGNIILRREKTSFETMKFQRAFHLLWISFLIPLS